MTLALDDIDQAMAAGDMGGAPAFAFEILQGYGEAVGATHFLDITGAHIDGCLYHGQVSLDFVERLIALGGRVKVPTTLNVGSMDLIHPEIMLQPAAEKPPLVRLMHAHEELGCMPSFTCAPYQTLFRPTFGQQIAWGESNAIVFANSVIGARTNRYGDFIDLCAAITGRVPACGLHLAENRRGQILFRLKGFSDAELESDATFVGIGLIIGFESGQKIPVVDGLPKPRDEDQLKALGAASATSGAVALFHAIGVTPEAPTLTEAFGGREPERVIDVTPADVRRVVAHLSGVADGTQLTAICLGTPHFSRAEWDRLLALMVGGRPLVPIYVNTGRETYDGLVRDGRLPLIEASDIRVVTDTCTYLTAILERLDGAVMTNSGKWAHYAPANIGVKVAFGELQDCVASAMAGRVARVGG